MTLKRCANCANGVWTCREQSVPEVCIKCCYKSNGDPSEWKPINPTNADRIRAMSDEELANVLTDYSNNGGWVTETGRQICRERIIDWLKQPAEVDHE